MLDLPCPPAPLHLHITPEPDIVPPKPEAPPPEPRRRVRPSRSAIRPRAISAATAAARLGPPGHVPHHLEGGHQLWPRQYPRSR